MLCHHGDVLLCIHSLVHSQLITSFSLNRNYNNKVMFLILMLLVDAVFCLLLHVALLSAWQMKQLLLELYQKV